MNATTIQNTNTNTQPCFRNCARDTGDRPRHRGSETVADAVDDVWQRTDTRQRLRMERFLIFS